MTARITSLDPRDPVDVCSEPTDDELMARDTATRFVDQALTGVNDFG